MTITVSLARNDWGSPGDPLMAGEQNEATASFLKVVVPRDAGGENYVTHVQIQVQG